MPLTPQQEKELEAELKKCESIAEMFDVIDHRFQLSKCKPGNIVKAGFISKTIKGLKDLNVPLK